MTLVLLGTPIGNLEDLSPRAARTLAEADVLACEDTRRTRALLTHLGVPAAGRLLSLHQHNEAAQVDKVLGHLAAGATVALVSDAGMPTISDPGSRLVRAVAGAGHRIEVVPGPSAVITALAASGLDASRFCFEGFLPRKGRARAAVLEGLRQELRTTVLFEAPHRVRATVEELLGTLDADRGLVVARELTKRFEEIWRGTLGTAVAHLAASPPRGEHVLVLAGASAPTPASEDQIADALRSRLVAGLDRRSAVAEVCRELGAPRNVVYPIATRMERP